MTSYTRLKTGAWGIRSTTELCAGQAVTVTKKDGGTKTEVVAKVVWSGNGVWLAAIAERARQSSRGSRRGGAPHGMIECDECGDYVHPGSVCWETGCRH